MQVAGIETLVSNSMIDYKAWHQKELVPTENSVPPVISHRVNQINEQQADLMEFLELLVLEYELTGNNGLKSRTGLLEYRYDAI